MDKYINDIKNDIRDWAKTYTGEEPLNERSIDDIRYELQMDDSVTGNASGSYFFNSYKAQQAINESEVLWDWDFIVWLKDLGFDLGTTMEKGPENMDVLARCCALDRLSDEEIRELITE